MASEASGSASASNGPPEREAMGRALDLALRGWGRVAPNPLVGAVVLQGGTVAGEGFHAEFGGPHAEVVALAAAGERARGSTVVVTLEPCAHHGKTPPCTEAIVAAGVTRVVAAIRDPDPEARGGAEVLRPTGRSAAHRARPCHPAPAARPRGVRPTGHAERDRQPRQYGAREADLGHGVAGRPGGKRRAAGAERCAGVSPGVARGRPADAA